MENACTFLFVYGTLLDDSNEFAAYLTKNCTFYVRGKFKGSLYDIGEYPGAIFNRDVEQYVLGSVFMMADAAETLKVLDAYEGVGKDQPWPDEFVRELIDVEAEDGPLQAWAYLYNYPVTGLWNIASGDYLGYIKS